MGGGIGDRWHWWEVALVGGGIDGRWDVDSKNWWEIKPQNRWEMGG